MPVFTEDEFHMHRHTAGMIETIKASGGGSVLTKEEVGLLMKHPGYVDAQHPHHAEISTAVRDHFQAAHPGYADHG